jgi:tetratricopeptide (TPR) repeat protein
MGETVSMRGVNRPAVHPEVGADSFLDLLADLEQHPSEPAGVIASYQAWIGRHSPASTALHAGWFNLGVELSAAGDKAGAINAYQQALTLQPGFYPAAINLGTLLEAAGQPDAALTVWQQALQPEDARTALLDLRRRLAEASQAVAPDQAVVLQIGYGTEGRDNLPPVFRRAGWRVIRLGSDPTVRPPG